MKQYLAKQLAKQCNPVLEQKLWDEVVAWVDACFIIKENLEYLKDRDLPYHKILFRDVYGHCERNAKLTISLWRAIAFGSH